jgi:hypothetical protein
MTIHQDESRENQSDELAQRLIEDYFGSESVPKDLEEAWAETSMRLAAEVFEEESWTEDQSHGSK